MIWTAKESIYKAIGIKGVSFSDNIIVKNINKNKGHGYYIDGKEKYKFDLKFFQSKNIYFVMLNQIINHE